MDLRPRLQPPLDQPGEAHPAREGVQGDIRARYSVSSFEYKLSDCVAPPDAVAGFVAVATASVVKSCDDAVPVGIPSAALSQSLL